MGGVVLRDDENAACVLVEAVNNPRTFLTANAGKIFAMGEERVHQGVLLMAGTGMNHEAGRLVQDEEIVIFEKNIQIHRLRLRVDLRNCGFADFDNCTRAHGIARPRRFSIHGHELFSNEGLKSGPGKGGERLGEKAIQALAGVCALDFELDHDEFDPGMLHCAPPPPSTIASLRVAPPVYTRFADATLPVR